MMMTAFKILLLFAFCFAVKSKLIYCKLNNKPIIGVLAQEYYSDQIRSLGEGSTEKLQPANRSYIVASYVKWIETGGARVVPILTDQSEDYYSELLRKINGAVFPGGANDLSTSSYARSARIVWKTALQFNSNGISFPVWGTCLGMEEIVHLAAGSGRQTLVNCSAYDVALPFNVAGGGESSSLIDKLTEFMNEINDKENITAHYHVKCVPVNSFHTVKTLRQHYRVVAHNKDVNGLRFVSMLEHRNFPIYASQFHPEKPVFEFFEREGLQNIPHSSEAIRLSGVMSRWLVDQARRNNHSFANETEERQALIYDHVPTVAFDLYSHYEPLYFFDRKINFTIL